MPWLDCSLAVVCDTAKVRFFKQITTPFFFFLESEWLFAILQKYDFSSKSQLHQFIAKFRDCCLRYCKSTIFQANHNQFEKVVKTKVVVCDTAKVRFFKQITTAKGKPLSRFWLFAILQKYDFSSKSQLSWYLVLIEIRCLRYCKSTIFQANHNSI